MRILLLPSGYPPVLGGVQTVTHGLAQELRKRGHTMWVLTNRYPRHLPRREVLDGVPVERALFLYPRLAQLRAGRPDVFLASWFYFPLALARLLWRIRCFRPNVVNLHFAGGMCLFVLIAARLFSFRLVVSLHGDDVEGLERGTRFDRWLFRALLRRVDAITVCSRYLLNQALAQMPQVSDKGRVIPNAVDWERFATVEPYSHPRPYLLAVGRLTHKKGFDLLLDAFAQVTAHAEIDLILAGEGEDLKRLEAHAQSLGLDSRAHFYGRATPEEVSQLMWGCQLVVIPSRAEPFGIVALEALAAGKPVVATTAGGLPEVLDGAEACLVTSGNEEALAEALRETLQAVAANPAYGRHNRELAASFSWDQLAEAYLQVYRGERS